MDVTVYVPTILAVSAVLLVIPRKRLKSEFFKGVFDLTCIALGILDIILAAYTYDELSRLGLYPKYIPIVLAVTGLTLTRKLYSYQYAPALLATVAGAIATVLIYVYLGINQYVLLAAVFIVVTSIVYSIVSYIFAILDVITWFLDLLPFRLIIAGATVVFAIAIAAGIQLPI